MRSIRRRLTIALIACFAALSGLGGATLFFFARSALRGAFDRALEAKARALAMLVEWERDGSLEFEFADELLPDFITGPAPEYFELLQPDGQVREASDSLAGRRLPRRAATPEAPVFGDMRLPDGRPGRAIWLSFVPKLELTGDTQAPEENNAKDEKTRSDSGAAGSGTAVTMIVARDRAALDQALAQLAGLLSYWAVRLGLAPLDSLAARVSEIGAETLSRRIEDIRMPSELRPIRRKLNDLLDRLESAFSRERQFTGNVAHELRTPIAELRSMAEVALAWPDDEDMARRSLESALDIARQMERIVAALLSLARIEAGALPLERAPVDLAAAIGEAWKAFEEQARAKGLRVEFDLAPQAELIADRAILRAALQNVFGNAVEYAPRGGEIRCRIARNGEGVAAIVENTQTGLTQEEIERVFDPFWRSDPSRTDSSHSGLGLTLVGSFMRCLGGRAEAALARGDRFRITLSFPLPPPAAQEAR